MKSDIYNYISTKYMKLRSNSVVSGEFRYPSGGNVVENFMEKRSSLIYLIQFR
jgi:hypothetical protein